MTPLVVIALGLAAGIAAAEVVKPAATAAAALMAAAVFTALYLESRGRAGYRAANAFLIFLLLGAFLASLIGRAPAGFKDRPPTHTNPVYQVIAKNARSALDDKRAQLFLAIVFGDQEHVNPDDKDVFRRSGLLHLFAASGFNVTIAAAFIMGLARLARAPKLPAASLGLLSIGFYFWLVGPSPSVARAAVMSSILYLGILFGRRVHALASTGAAAVVLLCVSPSSLFDIGWQLSFAGLLGILLAAPKISEIIKPEAELFAAPVVVTAGAQIMTAPLILYYFGQVSLVSIIANPVVAAAVGVITGVGFVGGAVTLVQPAVGRTIIALMALPLRFVDQSAAAFAALPTATLYIAPSIIAAALLLIVPGLIVYVFRRRRARFGLPALILVVLSVQVLGLWVDWSVGLQRQALTVNFLNIGQGDATLIKTASDEVILVDGGPDYRALNAELRERGVRHIDILLLSHAHADHVGALDELLDKYPVAAVVEPGFDYRTDSYRSFKRAVVRRHVRKSIGKAGQRYTVGDVNLDILWPRAGFLLGTDSDVNNNSIVARLTYKKFTLLLTGDIQNEAIDRLISGGAGLKTDVLKVSHQGSFNGTTVAFLRRARPRYAVISVGRNTYGHPHQAALRRLSMFVRRVARTDRDGDVTIGTDGYQSSFKTEY